MALGCYNKKNIHSALGVVTDGSYLWAGADKGIQSEMQGKNNGDDVYYKRTLLAGATVSTVSGGNGNITDNGSTATTKATKVLIQDSHVAYTVAALEKEIGDVGNELAEVRIGAKLAKAAVRGAITADMPLIGNQYAGADFVPFQEAASYIKSTVEGKLYGWANHRAWAKLTGQGQQSVALPYVSPRFGKDLVGQWSLVDELRLSQEMKAVKAGALGTASTAAYNASTRVLTVTLGASSNIAVGDTVAFTVAGIKNTDVLGEETGLFVFTYTNGTSGVLDSGDTFTITLTEDQTTFMVFPSSVSGAAVTGIMEAGSYYAPTLIRSEKAQCFGTMERAQCEGAKYSKSSQDGVNVHCNVDSDTKNFNDFRRWDMVYCSKLIEPRAAAIVWIKL